DPVKEQLIGSMRLRPEQDFRPEKEQLAFTHICFNDGGRVLKVFLAPGPAAAQRGVGVIPGNHPHTRPFGIGPEAEGWTVVDKDQYVELFGEIYGVEGSLINDVEREFEVFEHEPRPSGRNRAARPVPKSDADGPQL